MSNIKKKRGRPKEEGSKRNRLYVYLSDIELEIVKNAIKITGKSKSDFARIGLMNASYDALSKNISDADEVETVENDDGYYEDGDFYDD